MTLIFILSQIFSGLAFIMLALSYWQRKKSRVFAFQVADSLFDGIHFCLLKGFSGGVINFIGIIRSLVFMAKEKYKSLNNILVYIIFLAIYISVCVFTWNGIISILPTIGVLLLCTALWFGNTRTIRILGFISSIFWLSYDIFILSYVEITTEAILMLSTFISILKLDIIDPIKTSKDVDKKIMKILKEDL